jgi:hypothetical protein
MTDKPPPSSAEESTMPATVAPPPQDEIPDEDSDPDFDDLDGMYRRRKTSSIYIVAN